MAEEQLDFRDEENEFDNFDEELIHYYFYKGFTYKEIHQFLSEYHNNQISLSTLKRCMKQLGLQRRNAEYDIDLVRNANVSLLKGPDGRVGTVRFGILSR